MKLTGTDGIQVVSCAFSRQKVIFISAFYLTGLVLDGAVLGLEDVSVLTSLVLVSENKAKLKFRKKI